MQNMSLPMQRDKSQKFTLVANNYFKFLLIFGKNCLAKFWEMKTVVLMQKNKNLVFQHKSVYKKSELLQFLIP